MTQRHNIFGLPILVLLFCGCAQSEAPPKPHVVTDSECKVGEASECETYRRLRRCVGGEYVYDLCEGETVCVSSACVLPDTPPVCDDEMSPVCTDEVTFKFCRNGVFVYEKCLKGDLCEVDRCVRSSTANCSEGEKLCYDAKLLGACVDGEFVYTPCDSGMTCKGEQCVKDSTAEFVDGVWVLPLSDKAYTTLQRTFKPIISEYALKLIADRSLNVTMFRYFDQFGFGVQESAGEPWIIKESLLSAADPEISHVGKSLAYFWQSSDYQLIDEESPIRMEGTYITPFVVASAYRPQGHLSVQILDLHVQTAMRLSSLSSRPFDFMSHTGDLADSAQENEIGWYTQVMGGGLVDPDSAIDDDPIDGPNNDFADPFYAKGVGTIPYYPAVGNHDLLYMGFAAIRPEIQEGAVGDEVVDLFSFVNSFLGSHAVRESYRNGFRDASRVDAPVVALGKTPPDPRRRLLSKREVLKMLHDAPGLPQGHGLKPELIEKSSGYYSVHPIANKPIRLISMDTNSETFSEAVMSREQYNWLEAEISEANRANELVIIQSHHGINNMAGEVRSEDLLTLFSSYPGVILHITGHGHYNMSTVRKNLENKGYWEIMVASTVDFPSQSRIIEIVHEGRGIISIYVTNLDANAAPGSMVHESLAWASARQFFSLKKDPILTWTERKEHRNMILRTKVPERIWKNLDQYEWSSVVESVQTLKQLN